MTWKNVNTEAKNYTLGRGDVLFAKRKADGTLGGFRAIGNTPSFNLGAQSQSVKHYSSSRGMRVSDRDVPVQTDYSGGFNTDDINVKNVEALLLGESSTVSVTASADQTETFTDVEQGLTYQVGVSSSLPTGLRNITVTDVKVGVTSKVEGTDYTKDEELGLVTVIEGGSIANNDDMIVEYDRTAYSMAQVVSAAQLIEGAIKFIAHNVEGDDVDYYLPDVKLSPNGDYNIKTEQDWANIGFNLGINTPVDGAAIYCNGRPYTP